MDTKPAGAERRYIWTPYVASLAVREEDRRKGIARQVAAHDHPASCKPRPKPRRNPQTPITSTPRTRFGAPTEPTLVVWQLMRAAERTSRSWGYREIMLEVACTNDVAIGFYQRQGFRVRGSDQRGTGWNAPQPEPEPVEALDWNGPRRCLIRTLTMDAGATLVEVRGFYWQVLPVEKYIMRKGLGL